MIYIFLFDAELFNYVVVMILSFAQNHHCNQQSF